LLPILLTGDRIYVLVRGGDRIWCPQQQKNWMGILGNTHASWIKNTWSSATGFQPIGTLGVFKQRGIETMFWIHWEPKSRYTWAFREMRVFFVQWLLCVYSRIRC
jgi:hypothetical protein